MSIASLLNPIEESGVEHMFLNDEEIANLVTGQENDPSIGDPEEEELTQLTRAEKLKGLSVVISMLNLADPVEHQVHCQLRRIQSTIRFKNLQQAKLDGWLKQ